MLSNPIIKIFLTCFCGFLLSLSAPGYNLWLIAWFGLVPLFIIIYTSKKISALSLYSFLFGFAYNISCLHWIFSLHPLSWLGFSNGFSLFLSTFALVLVSAYNSIFFVLFSFLAFYLRNLSLKPYDKGLVHNVLVTVIWLVIFNKVSASKWLLGFPWTLIEYSQYKNLYLIQIAEYFGSISISFILIFVNLLLSQILMSLISFEKISNRYISKSPGEISSVIYSTILSTIFIFGGSLFGMYLYHKNQEHFTDKSKSVCILQGNLPLGVTRGSKQDINHAKKIYSNLIKNSNANLIILPEGALPILFNSSPNIRSWLAFLSKEKDSDIISGSYCKNGKSLTNCATLSKGNEFSYYEKNRLVPFGEFTPFIFILPEAIKRFANNLVGDGFVDGKQSLPLNTSIGGAGISICFELIFPEIIRKRSLQKSDFLINLSDLSWFSSDFIKQQFLSFGVFRAIENRKFVIIATNNGISAFIEPNGKIRSQSLPKTEGVLLDWINSKNKTTLYAKYGW